TSGVWVLWLEEAVLSSEHILLSKRQLAIVCGFAGISLGGFGLGEAAEDRGPLLEVVT
ncbi:unnamed protein product, partial [Sphagnum compactum]